MHCSGLILTGEVQGTYRYPIPPSHLRSHFIRIQVKRFRRHGYFPTASSQGVFGLDELIVMLAFVTDGIFLVDHEQDICGQVIEQGLPSRVKKRT